jgi:prepilin signal peptidase PulO-like enzyme (type II secretory pathway)
MYILVFLVSASIGSFLNVLVYRIPKGISAARGYSFCPNCNHRLHPLDLVPIFSFLGLGRRCRYCKQPISWRYAIVESITGIVGLGLFLYFNVIQELINHAVYGVYLANGKVNDIVTNLFYIGTDVVAGTDLADNTSIGSLLHRFGETSLADGGYNPIRSLFETGFIPLHEFTIAWLPLILWVVSFLLFCVLFTLSLIDMDTQEIPDRFHLCILILAILTILFVPIGIGLKSRLIAFVIISVPMFILAMIIPGAFGGGDIKLMAAAGLLLGIQGVILATFIGIITGGVYAVYLLVSKKNQRGGHFAFGPFLALGIFAAYLWSDTIVTAYLSLYM